MRASTSTRGNRFNPALTALVRPSAIVGVWLLCWASVTAADGPTAVAQQTDWSRGPVRQTPAIVWTSAFDSSEGVAWLANTGQIALSGQPLLHAREYSVSSALVGPAGLAAADIDQDFDLDLAVATIGGSEVVWMENLGFNQSAWTTHGVDDFFLGADSVNGRDLDGDGAVDLVGCAWTSGEFAWWRNLGSGVAWTKYAIGAGFTNAHWADTADVDGDGDFDVIGAAAVPGTIVWWRNDGGLPIEWTMQIVDQDFGGARSAVPVDLDRDGRMDILGAALEDDEVAWWRNTGGVPIGWVKNTIAVGFTQAHHAVASDIDLDGDLDVVGAGYGFSRIALWRNQGGDPIQWTRELVGGTFIGALEVQATDLDGDNRFDVVATSDRMHLVAWWRNNGGDPVSWPQQTIGDGLTNAWPLVVADLDGNGSLDVAAGASGGTDVKWWRVAEFGQDGWLESSPLVIPGDIVAMDCDLDASLPDGTGIGVLIRVGHDPDAMGSWRNLTPGTSLPVIFDGPGFLQYRLELSSIDPSVSPVVRGIQLHWTTSIEPQAPRRPAGRRQP